MPIAIDAGMGELGRHGLMITPELGSALKLATITTDLPLATMRRGTWVWRSSARTA